eukprot:CAMPEP_0170554124 /NCGR_PEP_ID=MMETSP0211-20121228/12012_1 /TAXON_ID=311385 /ORGANISM="Pseudokeronopsis sp., Strain OXSARD2" /LENGTH=150 /DNA_ID=CAMNT_0010862997 /DNA_START=39 /DNA_END=488 /DNA_ORIENTATION=+
MSRSENFILIFIITDLEDILSEVDDARIQQDAMRDIPEVGDSEPELEVLDLLVAFEVRGDVDPTLEAKVVEFFFREVVYSLERHELIIMSNLVKVQIDRSGEDTFGEEADDGGVDWDVQFEETQDVVDGVEARNWGETHELGDVLEGVDI